jgi:2-keto-myo-inositol isomerase
MLLVHINDVEDLPFDELTDGHRLLPGEGALPLDRILSTLRKRGYNGAYSLEVMRPAYRNREPLEYARAGLEATRAVLRKAGSA